MEDRDNKIRFSDNVGIPVNYSALFGYLFVETLGNLHTIVGTFYV